MAATILGSSLAFIDGSVVNVALPVLARDLHAHASALPWAINSYLLPLGALILLGGGLGDRFGRRRYFLTGLATFTLASVLCAAAPSFAWLLAGRAAQGLGAALLMPNSLAILGAEFAGEERGRAIGTWAAVGSLTGAIGPVLGGWLVDVSGWRAIFLINLPLALAAGFLAWRYVPDNHERAVDVPRAPLDVPGSVLATAGLGLVTWALTEASNRGSAAAPLWTAAALGVVILGLFVRNERRLNDRALMPPALFAARAFVGLTLFTLLLYASLGGLLVILPYLLIQLEHWSAVAAGAALLPVSVLLAVLSGLMGKLASRHGTRWPLTLGSALVAAGFASYTRVVAPLSYWQDILPPTVLIAIGLCACVAPLTTGVMESVDAAHAGIASGLNNAVARIAGLIATALLGFVFAQQASTPAFLAAFRWAAGAGAALALAASACAFVFLGGKPAPLGDNGRRARPY